MRKMIIFTALRLTNFFVNALSQHDDNSKESGAAFIQSLNTDSSSHMKK